MIRRPPRSTLSSSSAASDVYKRQLVVSVSLYYSYSFLPKLIIKSQTTQSSLARWAPKSLFLCLLFADLSTSRVRSWHLAWFLVWHQACEVFRRSFQTGRHDFFFSISILRRTAGGSSRTAQHRKSQHRTHQLMVMLSSTNRIRPIAHRLKHWCAGRWLFFFNVTVSGYGYGYGEIPRAWRCCLMHFTPNEHDWVKWFIHGSDSCESQERHFNDDMNGGNGVHGNRMMIVWDIYTMEWMTTVARDMHGGGKIC